MVYTVLPLAIFLFNVTILDHLPFSFIFFIYFVLKDLQMLMAYTVFWDPFFPVFVV